MKKFYQIALKNISQLVLLAVLFISGVAYAQAPTVTTNSSSLLDRGTSAVRLSGSATLTSEFPFGQVFFEYGRTTLYGSETSRESITDSTSFVHDASGLNEDTGYHFRAVLLASDGTFYYGEDKTFITKREPNFPGFPDDSTGNNQVGGSNSGTDDSGTNEPDSDDDGIPDSIECPDGNCPDSDGDGFTDEQDLDSDNDGIRDGDEADGQRTTPTFPTAGATAATDATDGADVTLGSVDSPALPPSGGGSLIANGTGVPNSSGPDPQFNNTPDGLIPCNGPDCGFNDAIRLIQNIINWIVWFSVIVIVIGIVYAGFLYMTGKQDNISKAKGMFKNMAIGMFFVLAGWLIVDTVLDVLLRDDFRSDASVDLLE